MTAQIIDKKKLIFRIENDSYQFVKPKYLYKNDTKRMDAVIKGSTMGWNITGRFFSYNNLKQLLK